MSEQTLYGLCAPQTAEQKQKNIEDWLKSGKSLTVLECINRFRTTELRKVICRLKKKGMAIVGTWQEEKGNRFKRYKLISNDN